MNLIARFGQRQRLGNIIGLFFIYSSLGKEDSTCARDISLDWIGFLKYLRLDLRPRSISGMGDIMCVACFVNCDR